MYLVRIILHTSNPRVILKSSTMEAVPSKLTRMCIFLPFPIEKAGISQLSPLARMEIEQQMEAVAPQIELTMEGKCPACGHEFAVPFDLERFFFSELRTSLDLLYREVHYLAYHYHWSEREIMEMSRLKRRRYMQVLADEIERLNDAVA